MDRVMDRVRRLVLGMVRLVAAAAEPLVTRRGGENWAKILPMFDRAPTLDIGLESSDTVVRGEVR